MHPGSSIPEAIGTIVTEAMGLTRDECADCGESPAAATVTGSRDRLCGACALEAEQDDSVAWDSPETRLAALAGQHNDDRRCRPRGPELVTATRKQEAGQR